jgi:phenylacetate-CoA ligase
LITSWVNSRLSNAGLPLTREGLIEYVQRRLKQVIGYTYTSSNFYGDLLRAKSITPDAVNDLNNFSKIPFTFTEDILKNPYPFLCVSQADVLRGFTVETLEGEMKQIFFTREDLERVVDSISSVFNAIGVTPNGRIAIIFPSENEWGIPDLISKAAKKSGGNSVLLDIPDLEKQIVQIEELKPEIIIGSAQQLFFLSAILQRRRKPLGASPKAVIASHGCVPYILTEKAKNMIDRSWNNLFEYFGITEMGFTVSFDCKAHNGLHLNEVDVYAEVVDPESGKPKASGEKGELVLTNLSSIAMPILRYRTGYLSSIIEEPCSCGDTLTRRLRIFSSLTTDEDLLNQPVVLRPF